MQALLFLIQYHTILILAKTFLKPANIPSFYVLHSQYSKILTQIIYNKNITSVKTKSSHHLMRYTGYIKIILHIKFKILSIFITTEVITEVIFDVIWLHQIIPV